MDRDLRDIYGRIQDSVIMVKGLKLISFEPGGQFYQLDSVISSGKWEIIPGAKNKLIIENGGKGFTSFSASVHNTDDSTAVLAENMSYNNDIYRLDWNLVRINNEYEGALFSTSNNAWRNKPSTAETTGQIRSRLAAILNFYAAYYDLISEKASYFIGKRVQLPLEFYQHGVGLKTKGEDTVLNRFFFSPQQADTAYHYLGRSIDNLYGKFPSSGNNYVKEYAAVMKLMSKEISNMED